MGDERSIYMRQPKEDRYTLADAMTWNEDERTELIGGLPVMMAPPSSKRHDRLVKFELYQRAGVLEYWIVDPELRTVQVCVLDGDSYRVAALYTERDIARVCSLEGCYVDLPKVFE